MQKGTRRYFFFLGVIFTAGILYISLNLFFTKGQNNSPVQVQELPKVYSPQIPKDANFAGEVVPLGNFEVYERIDREFLVNTYWHSFTLLAMKRANRWFPVIEPILKRNGIPDDFKYISVIESGLMNVISPAGATGYWQFMDGAAKKYDLEVNDEVDERYHVQKSTEAACRYIKDAYNQFGSWTLAAASYNMGTTGLQKQLDRQKVKSYYNLLLSEETSRYIARVISVKAIMTSPQLYGFNLAPSELYSPYQTTTVETSGSIDNLADFAIKQGYNYKILKLYNPWLRDITLTNKKGKTYQIQFPVKGTIQPVNEP